MIRRETERQPSHNGSKDLDFVSWNADCHTPLDLTIAQILAGPTVDTEKNHELGLAIQAGLGADKRIKDGVLTEGELFILNRQKEAGLAAACELAVLNRPFALSEASRFSKEWGIPLSDALSAALLGIVEAALRYDPAYAFTTLAKYWVKKMIKRRGVINLFFIPERVLNILPKVLKKIDLAESELLASKSPRELSQEERYEIVHDFLSNVKELDDDIDSITIAVLRWFDLRMSSVIETESGTLDTLELIASENPSPDTLVVRREIIRLLSTHLDLLEPMDRIIVMRRITGIGGDETFSAIAEDIAALGFRSPRGTTYNSETVRKHFLEAMDRLRISAGTDQLLKSYYSDR